MRFNLAWLYRQNVKVGSSMYMGLLNLSKSSNSLADYSPEHCHLQLVKKVAWWVAGNVLLVYFQWFICWMNAFIKHKCSALLAEEVPVRKKGVLVLRFWWKRKSQSIFSTTGADSHRDVRGRSPKSEGPARDQSHSAGNMSHQCFGKIEQKLDIKSN